MRSGWIIACAFVGACSPFGAGAFTCTDDSQCTLAGAPGVCQANGMCSFDDPSCASDQRYGQQAGGLSGSCVGAEVIDAGPIPIDITGDTEPPVHDAACDVDNIQFCNDTGFAPSGPMQIATDTPFDTDTDPACHTYNQPSGGPAACFVFVSSLEISEGAKLTATGSRPLIIVASGSMTISGTLDVSSNNNQTGAGATSTSCNDHSSNSTGSQDGASGGAGGSFFDKGGDSGVGNKDAQDPKHPTPGSKAGDAMPLPAFSRGGCKGIDGGDSSVVTHGGHAGNPGGGVWLYANDINVSGAILAGGGGGRGADAQAGGGGGGTGGFIRLSAVTIEITGTLAANGGGGGQGGSKVIGVSGKDGSAGKASMQAASGGSGGVAGGAGGDGSIGAGGEKSSDSSFGSGGGGAGAGFIVLNSETKTTAGSTISPPAM